MLNVKSNDGEVTIVKMEGTEERVVNDVGAIAHKTLLMLANSRSKSAEEVFFRYGILARQLTDYIETTMHRVDELDKNKEK